MTSKTAIGKAALHVILALLLASCASAPTPEPDPEEEPKKEEVLDIPVQPSPAYAAAGDSETMDVENAEGRAGEAGAKAEEPTGEVEGSPETGDGATSTTASDIPSDDDDEPSAEAEPEEEKPEPSRRRGRIVLDTVYDDQRVGEDQTQLIEAELGLVSDEALNEYVTSVAIRLLRHAPSRPFNWEFKIVDQSVPNAFALPGGKIFVSRGLLALATSEDELAGVIGHEITHSAERHASAQMEYNRRMNPLTIGLLRAAKIAAYGRDQERDADRGGQILAARAGYDPEGIATFLRKLDASERYEVGWSRIPSFLATHPTSPERSALATNRAASLEWERKPGVAADGSEETKAYYEMVDGLIIGSDPAGGLFDEDNRFVHPELRFSIRFPQGWTTMNSQQAVRALSPGRDAQAELTVAGGGPEPLSEIVDNFLEREFDGMRMHVRDRREIKIGELPAIRVEGRASSGLGGVAAQMTFVRYGDLVYRLTVLSIATSVSKYRGRGRAFAHSFRPLDDEGVRSLKVTRLRIAHALENETLQELSIRTRNELEVVFTGVINGLYASTPLAHRTPIKIGIAEPYLPLSEAEEPEREEGAGEGEGEQKELPKNEGPVLEDPDARR